MTENTKRKSKVVPVLIIVFLLIIGALVAVIIKISDKDKNDEGTAYTSNSSEIIEEKRNVVINEDNVDELIDQLSEEEKTPPGSYEVAMSTLWNFGDGESISEDAYVENSISNTNDVFFDVKLAETDEVIYKSPLLPVGSHVENIALEKKLEKGTYDCIVVYSLVDEEQDVLSEVQVKLKINVQS